MAIRSLKNGTFSRSLLIGNEFYVPPSFNLIQTYTLSSAQSSVTFSSIATDWNHLQIRCFAETNRASGFSDMQVQLNSDTGANYSWHMIMGTGAAISAQAGASASFMVLGSNSVPSSGAQPNIYNGLIIDILDYKDTNKYKTLRGLGGNDANGSGYVSFNSGSWRSTSAVTSIKLYPDTGSFNTYSRFSLYGISE